MTTKQEVLKDKLADYLAADKAGKGEILKQLEQTIHMHRQSIIRRLNTLAVRDPGWKKSHCGRKELYGPRVTEALNEIWELTDHIWRSTEGQVYIFGILISIRKFILR